MKLRSNLRNKSFTFAFNENRRTISALDLSPDGNVLVSADECVLQYFLS